jgi:glycosyltransferase involved in cell wall biosynthesis
VRKRILALNFPLAGGATNRFLFGALEKLGWSITAVNIPIPDRYRFLFMATTFRLPKAKWSKEFYAMLERFEKTPMCFSARTRLCERQMARAGSEVDLIFQIGGLFAPSAHLFDKPYVTFNDYTTRLAKKRYPEWAAFRSTAEEDDWFRLETNLYQNAARVFATSENTRCSVVNDYGGDPAKVLSVGQGLNFDAIPDTIGKRYDSNTILFIGKDFERKGGFVLLEAFRRVREKLKDARLVIVGQNQVRMDVEGVEWKGRITDRSVIRELYLRSSVFVMPSLCEPFGMVFLEAMAHKLPCIGTNIDAIPEIIADGETGLLAEVGSVTDLAEKVATLLSSQSLMKQFGAAGYQRVANRFTWNRVAGRINRELCDVLLSCAKAE